MGSNRQECQEEGEGNQERITYFDALVTLIKMYPAMTMLEAKRTTLADYEVLVDAYQQRQVNERFIASYTAFQIAKAQSTDAKGKMIYNSFNKLFDYEKELNQLKETEIKKSKKANKVNKNLIQRLTEINKEVSE